MITSKTDYLYYLEADRIAKGIPNKVNLKSQIRNLLLPIIYLEISKTTSEIRILYKL